MTLASQKFLHSTKSITNFKACALSSYRYLAVSPHKDHGI